MNKIEAAEIRTSLQLLSIAARQAEEVRREIDDLVSTMASSGSIPDGVMLRLARLSGQLGECRRVICEGHAAVQSRLK